VDHPVWLIFFLDDVPETDGIRSIPGFDLDYLGSEVPEHGGRKRGRDNRPEIKDPNIPQRKIGTLNLISLFFKESPQLSGIHFHVPLYYRIGSIQTNSSRRSEKAILAARIPLRAGCFLGSAFITINGFSYLQKEGCEKKRRGWLFPIPLLERYQG
jgi:hypothetical protein